MSIMKKMVFKFKKECLKLQDRPLKIQETFKKILQNQKLISLCLYNYYPSLRNFNKF